MIHDDAVYGEPLVLFKGTEANIDGGSYSEGAIAYSTDEHDFGFLDDSSWQWMKQTYLALAGGTMTGALGIGGAATTMLEVVGGDGNADEKAFRVSGTFSTAISHPVQVETSHALANTNSLAAFDAKSTVTGSADPGHMVSFQSRLTYNSSGTLSDLYGFYDLPTISAGTVTDRFGTYIAEATGAGSLTNNYGLYVEELTKGGTLNYAVYTAGSTVSYFGGAIGVGMTPNDVLMIGVQQTWTSDASVATVQSRAIQNTSAGYAYGYIGEARTTGANNVTALTGVRGTGNVYTTSGITVNYAYGAYGRAGIEIAGSSATLSNAYGLYGEVVKTSGTISNAYGLYLKNINQGGAYNFAIYSEGGNVSLQGKMGINLGLTTPTGQMHVDQSSTSAAIPVITLDQADVSEEFIRFIGTAAAATKTNSIVANGVPSSSSLAAWLRIYVQDDGNQITDQAYYFPIYTLS